MITDAELLDCIETVKADFYTLDNDLKEPERRILEGIKSGDITVDVKHKSLQMDVSDETLDGSYISEEQLNRFIKETAEDFKFFYETCMTSDKTKVEILEMFLVFRVAQLARCINEQNGDESYGVFLAGHMSALCDIAKIIWPDAADDIEDAEFI